MHDDDDSSGAGLRARTLRTSLLAQSSGGRLAVPGVPDLRDMQCI